MTRWRAVGVVLASLFAAFVAALSTAAPASAHAVVVITDPVDGARLTSAPSQVTVSFDEPVALNVGYFRVIDNTGRRVDRGNPTHPGGDPTKIAVALASGLGDGGYLASFRVVSADSHPVGGTVRFVVGNGSFVNDTTDAGDTRVNRVAQASLAGAHTATFVGLSLLAGGWIVFTIWPSGRRRASVVRTVWTGWFVLAAGTVAELLLQGVYGGGGPLSDVLKWSLLDATLHENTGQILCLRLLLLGLLAGVLTVLFSAASRMPSWTPELAAMLGLGVVVTFAAGGHAQVASPRWFAVLVAALHVLAMALWLGGLVILVLAARPSGDAVEDRGELLAGLPVFSRTALTCIVVLAGTGTIQAWREIHGYDAFVHTLYGRLVLLKIVLFFVIVGLGYLSRRIVLSRPDVGGAFGRLRRTVVVEIVTAAAVLLATGTLIIQAPGRTAIAIAHAKPRVETVSLTAGSEARVQVTPGTHGPVAVRIDITGGDTPLQVSATASLPAQQIGPIALDLSAATPRSLSVQNVVLPAKGDWRIDLTVRTSQFDSTVAATTVHLY